MGIYDRDYARDRRPGPGGGPPQGRLVGVLGMWSVNTWIILINIAVYLIDQFTPIVQVVVATTKRPDGTVAGVTAPMHLLTAYGHFSTATGFMQLEVWRLVTFQFLHANFTHIFFNMFGLFIFGGIVEEYLGSKRYAASVNSLSLFAVRRTLLG